MKRKHDGDIMEEEPFEKKLKMDSSIDLKENTTSLRTSEFVIKSCKLSNKARIPERKSKYAAGYDLYSAYEKMIPKRGRGLVKTDIAMEIPPEYYGRVAPRSGLTLKNGIDVGAGVIDSDYRGNIGVILFNHSDEDFHVKVGDRIAQLLIIKIGLFEIMEVDKLQTTERGSGGFGSTGTKE